MAREDILAQLMRTLMQKEGPPEESDNSILQKMIIPRDRATISDILPIVAVQSVAAQKWGGVDANGNTVNPGWSWCMGQWVDNNQNWASIQNSTWSSIGNLPWNNL